MVQDTCGRSDAEVMNRRRREFLAGSSLALLGLPRAADRRQPSADPIIDIHQHLELQRPAR